MSEVRQLHYPPASTADAACLIVKDCGATPLIKLHVPCQHAPDELSSRQQSRMHGIRMCCQQVRFSVLGMLNVVHKCLHLWCGFDSLPPLCPACALHTRKTIWLSLKMTCCMKHQTVLRAHQTRGAHPRKYSRSNSNRERRSIFGSRSRIGSRATIQAEVWGMIRLAEQATGLLLTWLLCLLVYAQLNCFVYMIETP